MEATTMFKVLSLEVPSQEQMQKGNQSMYGGLPNTGLNISTPIYLIVVLLCLIASGLALSWNKAASWLH